MIYYKICNIVYITDTDPPGVTEHSQSGENQQYVPVLMVMLRIVPHWWTLLWLLAG